MAPHCGCGDGFDTVSGLRVRPGLRGRLPGRLFGGAAVYLLSEFITSIELNWWDDYGISVATNDYNHNYMYTTISDYYSTTRCTTGGSSHLVGKPSYKWILLGISQVG